MEIERKRRYVGKGSRAKPKPPKQARPKKPTGVKKKKKGVIAEDEATLEEEEAEQRQAQEAKEQVSQSLFGQEGLFGSSSQMEVEEDNGGPSRASGGVHSGPVTDLNAWLQDFMSS